jgi:hypothetical protein
VHRSENDVQVLKKLPLSVAAQSRIYGDAAYTDYTIEDDIKEAGKTELMIQRRCMQREKRNPGQCSSKNTGEKQLKLPSVNQSLVP